MFYTDNDLSLFCLCLWREARGEGEDGMQAVGQVIVNRVGALGFAHTLHDVIMGRNQFTSMSIPSDPEYKLFPAANDSQAAFIANIAPKILGECICDITGGAHYYADLKETTSGWFFRNIVHDDVHHPHTVKIGRHDFYV